MPRCSSSDSVVMKSCRFSLIDFAHGTRRLPQSENLLAGPILPGCGSLESRWDGAFRAVERRGLALIGSRG